MNYRDCLDYLNRLGNEVLTMKLGLENIQRLLALLGHPHLSCPCILIAGTNGKGSTARFLAALLHYSGYRTGLYTSPHLVDLRERIAVDGQLVSPGDFAAAFSEVTEAISRLAASHHPTYFETLTATAFLSFARQEVEVTVLEVGLGGRLDSTNVVLPHLSIITPVALDHTQVLGDTLEQIAGEKAGIIHPDRPVLLAPQHPAAGKVLEERARHLQAPLHHLDLAEVSGLESAGGCYTFRFRGQSFQLALPGRQQVENAALALRAAELLGQRGLQFRRERMGEAIAALEPYSVLRPLEDSPLLLIDGGHNPAAAERLREFLLEHTRTPRHLVLGMMRDKQIESVGSILAPCFDRVFLTRIDSPRAATLERLQEAIPEGIAIPDLWEALEAARPGAETVVVTGSFYLVGEVAGRLAGTPLRFWPPPRKSLVSEPH